MAKKTFKIDETRVTELQNALRSGAPLLLALQYAGISRATYYYWVALASIVVQVNSQMELEEAEKIFNSGVSIQQIRDLSEAAASSKRTGIGTFIEPTQESILQYKNNRRFKKFADQCFEVVSECNKIRSQIALIHLNNIRKSTDKKNRINASGSMWFLERTLPDFFAKPTDKAVEQNQEQVQVESIRVEYVDPETEETQKRLDEMQADLEAKINGVGNA